MHLRRHSLASLFLVLLGVQVLFAQIDRAVLEGTVTDETGAVLAGATVQVAAVDTGILRERQTNGSGYYRVSGLGVGRYTINVKKDGFKTMLVKDRRSGRTHVRRSVHGYSD